MRRAERCTRSATLRGSARLTFAGDHRVVARSGPGHRCKTMSGPRPAPVKQRPAGGGLVEGRRLARSFRVRSRGATQPGQLSGAHQHFHSVTETSANALDKSLTTMPPDLGSRSPLRTVAATAGRESPVRNVGSGARMLSVVRVDDLDDDPDPPPSHCGLLIAALILLTGFLFILSWLRGWRLW